MHKLSKNRIVSGYSFIPAEKNNWSRIKQPRRHSVPESEGEEWSDRPSSDPSKSSLRRARYGRIGTPSRVVVPAAAADQREDCTARSTPYGALYDRRRLGAWEFGLRAEGLAPSKTLPEPRSSARQVQPAGRHSAGLRCRAGRDDGRCLSMRLACTNTVCRRHECHRDVCTVAGGRH